MKKRITNLLLAVTFGIISGGTVMATEAFATVQQDGKKHVSGVVKDNTGAPVPGVTIMLPNTTVGTITDIEGRYSIDVPTDATTLEVMSMGYATVQITLGTASVYDVILEDDKLLLEEVVVVGYGTQKKVNLTGAVSTVNLRIWLSHVLSLQ